MALIRRILLALIALLSGAWLTMDALKNSAQRAVKKAGRPVPKTTTAVAGAKSGAVAMPRSSLPASTVTKREKTEAKPIERETKPVSVPGAEDTHRSIHEIHGPIAYLRELYNRFNGDQCPAWAAALSFFVILATVPLLLVGLAAVGFLIHDPHRAAEQVRVFIQGMLPGKGAASAAGQLIDNMKIAEQAKKLMDVSSVMGVIGIGSLLWAASRIFVNAATPMNAAFQTKETRGFLPMQGMAFGLLLAGGLLFLLSFVPSTGAAMINRLHIPGIAVPVPTPFLLNAFFFLLAIAINAAMYTVIYRFLPSPSANITWKDAAVGGAVVAVLWEIAKQGFALYLRKQGGDSYNYVSGAAAGVFIAVIWVYYSSMILLLGAEIIEMYRDHQEKVADKVAATT